MFGSDGVLPHQSVHGRAVQKWFVSVPCTNHTGLYHSKVNVTPYTFTSMLADNTMVCFPASKRMVVLLNGCMEFNLCTFVPQLVLLDLVIFGATD